jgi:predicted Rossmann fold nucleotide-binding protein DprA/Smf involved in DNA uptake
MTATNRDLREVIREETYMRTQVLGLLADGPKTVPEIADALGKPAHETMFWVMGMRRYGWVREVPGDEDGYFRYQAVDREKK